MFWLKLAATAPLVILLLCAMWETTLTVLKMVHPQDRHIGRAVVMLAWGLYAWTLVFIWGWL